MLTMLYVQRHKFIKTNSKLSEKAVSFVFTMHADSFWFQTPQAIVYIIGLHQKRAHSFTLMTIRIQSTFSSIIRQNTNTLFDLLFGQNIIFGTALQQSD